MRILINAGLPSPSEAFVWRIIARNSTTSLYYGDLVLVKLTSILPLFVNYCSNRTCTSWPNTFKGKVQKWPYSSFSLAFCGISFDINIDFLFNKIHLDKIKCYVLKLTSHNHVRNRHRSMNFMLWTISSIWMVRNFHSDPNPELTWIAAPFVVPIQRVSFQYHDINVKNLIRSNWNLRLWWIRSQEIFGLFACEN